MSTRAANVATLVVSFALTLVSTTNSASQQSTATVIPRHSGASGAVKEHYGAKYDPQDTPLAWLPNGEILVAHEEQYSAYDVHSSTCDGSGFFIVPVSGGKARPLVVGTPACEALRPFAGVAAEPTGAWVVYSELVPSNTSRLVRIELPSARVDTLSTGCKIYQDQPAVSRDGRLIASRGLCVGRDQNHYRVYVTDADGSGLRPAAGLDSASHGSPTWSPDAKQVAFGRTRRINEDRVEEVAVVTLGGQGEARALTRGYFASWSPDGQLIAFLHWDGRDRDSRTIRVIRPDGTGERLVFRNAERTTYARGWGPMLEGGPSGPLVWSPDSRWLAFGRTFDRGKSIWRVELSTGNLVQVTTPGR